VTTTDTEGTGPIPTAYDDGLKPSPTILQVGRIGEKPEHEQVNHPKHYTSHPSGIECIEITRHMGFNTGNAMKYVWRADLKGSDIIDLEKAIWYLQDEVNRRRAQ
jgi:hypothetical protein